jgi:ATP-dependent Clp protease, protease subunit
MGSTPFPGTMGFRMGGVGAGRDGLTACLCRIRNEHQFRLVRDADAPRLHLGAALHLPPRGRMLRLRLMDSFLLPPAATKPFPRLDDDGDDEKKQPVPPMVGGMIQKKFLEQRKVFLWGAVTDESSEDLMNKFLYLDAVEPGKEITFYLNTPGGSITAGMAVFDCMKMIQSPITVVVTGMAASMGSILLSAAPKGRRLLFPHSRVLIHQPLITGRMIGPAVDINIQAREMERLREELNAILATASGQPLDRIMRDTDRDFFLNAKEAIEYGLADRIVEKL